MMTHIHLRDTRIIWERKYPRKKIGISVEFVTDLESAYYISFIVRNVECVCLYGSGKDTI